MCFAMASLGIFLAALQRDAIFYRPVPLHPVSTGGRVWLKSALGKTSRGPRAGAKRRRDV
jgi:hypothetical protein